MFDLARDGYEIDEQTLSEMGVIENATKHEPVSNVGSVASSSSSAIRGPERSQEYSFGLCLLGSSPVENDASASCSPSLSLRKSDPTPAACMSIARSPRLRALSRSLSTLSPSTLSGGGAPSPTFRTIDYREIKFVSGTPIGRGAFGVVYAAEWRGAKVAVKQLLTFIDAEELAILLVECAILHHCSNHPNVIKFVGACLESGTFYVVTAFCAGGSVYDAFVVRREAFSHADTLRILRDSACGIMHLHKENVIHRDIAARNFLLDEQRNVYVTDFGMARVKTAAYQHTQSSMGPVKYMAPESIALKRYSEQSDAFSFGVYIWEVMHRCEPYAGIEINFEMMAGIVNGTLRLSIDATIATDFSVLSDLMQECWRTDPLTRPSISNILARLR
jgi:predicted Ser/Thr protein kinase